MRIDDTSVIFALRRPWSPVALETSQKIRGNDEGRTATIPANQVTTVLEE
jgi:hypothetical protein